MFPDAIWVDMDLVKTYMPPFLPGFPEFPVPAEPPG